MARRSFRAPQTSWHLSASPTTLAVAMLSSCAPDTHPGHDSGFRTSVRYLDLPPGGPCVPEISQFKGKTISSLPCSMLEVHAPFAANFGSAESGMLDGANQGLGLTMFLPSTNGRGFLPQLLAVSSGGELALTTTSGINQSAVDTQDNVLGVGIDLPNGNHRIEVSLMDAGQGSGNFEQAGIWFGMSEADFVKLIVQSTPNGTFLQALLEEGNVLSTSVDRAISLPVDRVDLALEALPARRQIRAKVRLGSGAEETILTSFAGIPDAWFSTDGAGIDFNVGTRSFGGIAATHRRRPPSAGPITFHFADFRVTTFEDLEEPDLEEPEPPDTDEPEPPDTDEPATQAVPGGLVDFERFSVPVKDPTALAWGPDGRLYAGSVTGTIHALRLDYDGHALLSDQLIRSVENRLLLGLTLDPESTRDDVVLWVAHSDVSQGSGAANSGVVSRLSGPGLAERRDVVVGLPRALANHSTNHLRFGPDGRLYISQGGNTGAGAANDGTSEFGPRPEQPLSAALLVADVKAAGFDGDCRSSQDVDGALMDASGIAGRGVPCDVAVYASGLRNSYDAVFHSNGQLYATDNALGVEGTFPRLAPTALGWDPARGCEGPILGAALDAHNPGTRRDLLLRLEPGGYYGHPNPSRRECVFYTGNPTAAVDLRIPETGGGSLALDVTQYPVGVLPDPRFRPAMFSFGEHKSANGIIEYGSDAFCGRLKGDLLVTYYSTPDQVRRLSLSADGTRVVSEGPLPRSSASAGGTSLVDPLPITQDPLGRIYVGEFGADRVSIFEPLSSGCWQEGGLPSLPAALLDAGGSELDDQIYVVAGKTAEGAGNSLFVLDVPTKRWRVGPKLPSRYPAVENPAVVSLEGRLYVLGGATDPFEGAVSNAAAFQPSTQSWVTLPDLPEPRGGASVQAIGGAIYLAGGMDRAGVSRAELFIYDPASNRWSAAAPMSLPRDNPMSASIGERLYVFGGRTRGGSGQGDAAALHSAEVYDIATNTWSAIAAMPTGRRTGNAIVVRGRVVVFGGEGAGTLAQNELYDPSTNSWSALLPMPSARHGAVAARVGNGIYVIGGGLVQGSSFTDDVDVFRF